MMRFGKIYALLWALVIVAAVVFVGFHLLADPCSWDAALCEAPY